METILDLETGETPSKVEAPERIWIDPNDTDTRGIYSSGGGIEVEYVRADRSPVDEALAELREMFPYWQGEILWSTAATMVDISLYDHALIRTRKHWVVAPTLDEAMQKVREYYREQTSPPQ